MEEKEAIVDRCAPAALLEPARHALRQHAQLCNVWHRSLLLGMGAAVAPCCLDWSLHGLRIEGRGLKAKVQECEPLQNLFPGHLFIAAVTQ
jgi:hypothetical protein